MIDLSRLHMLSNKMEKFHLTWQSHASTSSTLLVNLLNSKELTDVTLVSADMKELKAHRVILGSVSSVFKELFSRNSEQIFCVYLGGTYAEELQALLNFIYVGEATVSQWNIDSFFKVAKQFKIEGLTSYSILPSNTQESISIANDNLNDSDERETKDIEDVKTYVHTPNFTISYPSEYCEIEAPTESDMNTQKKSLHTINEFISPIDNSYNMSDKEVEDGDHSVHHLGVIEDVMIYKPRVKNHEVEQIIPIPDTCGKLRYPCNKCTYLASTKDTLKNHLDFIHNGLKVICEKCNKIYASISALKRHMAIEHRGKVFICDLCDYQSKSPDSLRNHRRRVHF